MSSGESPDKSSPEFFDAMYKADADPWQFAKDPYELERYDALMKVIGEGPFAFGFEPGCSVGVLTERLARVCERVAASDFSETAVKQARERCAALPNVDIQCEALTADVDLSPYDLVVISEIGYYFDPEEWERISAAICRGMRPDSTLVACHWLGHSPDHADTGDSVHVALLKAAREAKLVRALSQRNEDADRGGYRIEMWKCFA